MVGFGIGFNLNAAGQKPRAPINVTMYRIARLLPCGVMLIIFILFENITQADCSRIISLSPSITEILYKLDLGSSVVGVSDYDAFPIEVKNIPKVGPSLSPSLEAILRLKPKVVFLLSEHREVANRIKNLSIEVNTFEHRSITGIIDSIGKIGEICNAKNKAEQLLNVLNQSILKAEQERIKKDVPILFIVGRDYTSSTLKDIYLSGQDGFYDELVRYAGGKNVITENTIGLKGLSLEALIRLNPKIIIEIVPPETHLSEEQLKLPWNDFKSIEAVRNDRIYFLREDWSYTPGPRFTLLLERLIEIIQS